MHITRVARTRAREAIHPGQLPAAQCQFEAYGLGAHVGEMTAGDRGSRVWF